MRKILGCLLVVLIISLTACQPKVYTYNDLDDTGKQIIDTVYNHLSEWETVERDNFNYQIADIEFLSSSEGAGHAVLRADIPLANAAILRKFSVSTSEFSLYSSETVGMNYIGAEPGRVWQLNWTESQKKNYLARQYAIKFLGGK